MYVEMTQGHVLERLPTHQNSQIAQLLPHRWTPTD